MNTFEELIGLEVCVDDVLYMPSLDAPVDKPHPFVYFICIRNNSAESVTIKARKWVVHEEGDEVVVVEGEGVVGKKPFLKPGEEFRYNSYHVLARNGRANGAFFGETMDGRRIATRVPEFEMKIPDWA